MAPVAVSRTQEATAPASAPAEPKQSLSDLPKEALNRVWRGNAEGTIKLDAFPDYWTKTDEESLLKKRQYVKVSVDGNEIGMRGWVASNAWGSAGPHLQRTMGGLERWAEGRQTGDRIEVY